MSEKHTDHPTIELPELWVLEHIDEDGNGEGEFIRAVDDSPGDDRLCYLTREDAEHGAKHQLDLYGFETRPARVVITCNSDDAEGGAS